MSRPGALLDADRQVLRARLRSQLLSGLPAASAEDAVGRVLAVQAQDPRGFRLAVRARTTGLTAGDVDRALTVDRTLVVTWLHRGTLHLVRSQDLPWLHLLTTPQLLTANARRLAQEGAGPDDAERAVAAVVRALEREGPLPREVLAERVAGAGAAAQGPALAHLLVLTALRGLTVRGPVVGGRHAFVLVRDWLGAPPAGSLAAHLAGDRGAALAELARRYLRGHSPADDRDLARWSGITLGDARRALSALTPAEREAPAPDGDPPRPRLLGPFDPLLHGWASRELVLGDRTGVASGVVSTNGLFRATALVEGRAVATWTAPGGRVVVSPLVGAPALDAEDAAALAEEAADVERFLRPCG